MAPPHSCKRSRKKEKGKKKKGQGKKGNHSHTSYAPPAELYLRFNSGRKDIIWHRAPPATLPASSVSHYLIMADNTEHRELAQRVGPEDSFTSESKRRARTQGPLIQRSTAGLLHSPAPTQVRPFSLSISLLLVFYVLHLYSVKLKTCLFFYFLGGKLINTHTYVSFQCILLMKNCFI